jgi:dolichol-phosphate mannosyltransferase
MLSSRAAGSMGEFAREHVKLSDIGTKLGSLVCRCEVSDAMSGFFIVESLFLFTMVPRLTGFGLKIPVDILASSPMPPRTREISHRFSNRQLGESR